MRTPLRLAGLLAGAALMAACGDVPADVAATVAGSDIPVSALESRVRSQVASPAFQDRPAEQRTADVSTLQQQVLSQMVFSELLRRAAADLGIEVTEQDVDDEWQVQLSFFGSEEELLARLDELGLSVADAREQLRTELLRQRIEERFTSQVEVGEEELRTLYEERRAQYEMVTYGHVVVEDERTAQQVLTRLEEGAAFADVAREHSIDPGAAGNGGETGPRPVTQVDPDLVAALREAAPGEVVGPVTTADGLVHVLRLDAFEVRPFEEVRDSLRDEIATQRSSSELQAFFTEFVGTAEVAVNPRFGDWDPGTLTIVPPARVGTAATDL